MNFAGKKKPLNMAESRNVSTTGLNLSSVNTTNTFKNVLRNGDASVISFKFNFLIFVESV